jgi:nucleoside-diphosphate-sugar epimerase
VKDIVRAHIRAGEKESVGNQYVLGGTQASFKEAFDTIAVILKKKPCDKALSRSALRAATYFFMLKSLIDKKEPMITMEKYKRLVGKQIIDDRRAVKELDLKRSPLKKMFSDSYNWLLQENLLET